MKLGKLDGEEFALDEAAAGLDIRGLSADSRAIVPGYLFAALAGSKADGGKFGGSGEQDAQNGALWIGQASISADRQ